jgi:hypothetical protein
MSRCGRTRTSCAKAKEAGGLNKKQEMLENVQVRKGMGCGSPSLLFRSKFRSIFSVQYASDFSL